MIYYCYERATGDFAGSGTPQIDTETHGSTPLEPTFDDGRCLQSFDEATGQWLTTWITSAAFTLRFTPTEIAAVMESADPNVVAARTALQAAPWVRLTAPETEQGIAAIVLAGLLTPGRGIEILTPSELLA